MAKRMMPTDNTIIQDELLTIGDKQENVISLSMGSSLTLLGIKKIPQGNNKVVDN